MNLKMLDTAGDLSSYWMEGGPFKWKGLNMMKGGPIAQNLMPQLSENGS